MKKERLLLTFLLLWQCVNSKTLLDEIRSIPNFSKVKEIIEASRILPILLETRGFTAFIPTNEAMDRYDGVKDEKLISYHLANIAYKIQDVPDELTTELSGNPRIYVTRIPSGNPSITGWENYEYFINNAKVISANHRAETDTQDNQVQYLHTVDQVIAPTVVQVAGPQTPTDRYPDARRVLEKSNIYGLTERFSLRDFYGRVRELKTLDTFEMKGKNTFFMPANQALQLILKSDKVLIDKQVIHGHIVPDEVLFTRTVRDSKKQYKSLAFTDNLKAFISIKNVTSSETNEISYYVTSNTLSADPSHMKGAALARIVKGNIPVKNGVLHLIDRPLMIVASNIMSYFQEEGGQLTQFHKLMGDHYPDMGELLINEKDITLFAPSNKAFDMVNRHRLDKVIANSEKLKKIMLMHVVRKRLTTDDIAEEINRGILQVETMTPGRKLFFAVSNSKDVVPSVTLEGGGVNATIRTPNIAARNGVIHIIDRILGIPSQTVYEKLASDPMLSSTYALSKQNGWNDLLKDRNKKFTLFVPSNTAWEQIGRKMSSAYKKLFMGKFPTHVRSILQRHMIVNQDLTLEELDMLTTNSTPIRDNVRQSQLQMTRGKIYFQAKVIHHFGAVNPNANDDTEYSLQWNGVNARVIRPDVECVNGVVHVIDKVLMAKRDVTVSSSNRYTSRGIDTLFAAVMSVTLAWVLI